MWLLLKTKVAMKTAFLVFRKIFGEKKYFWYKTKSPNFFSYFERTTYRTFFIKFSKCLSKPLPTCLEEVFEDELFCIFLFYKSIQFLSIFFIVFVQKIWIFLSKVHSKFLDEKMFLRKLLPSIYFWIIDGILSAGLSWWHFALLHEEFVE